MQLYVFDRKDKITLIDGFTSLTPEAHFDVNVYTWAIDSSDNVKALRVSSRKCTLETVRFFIAFLLIGEFKLWNYPDES